MKTYCKHCINTCKTPDVKDDCPKYKTEDMAEIRKDYVKNKDKIVWFDYGIENK
jgi:hypothetical protein